MPKLTILKNIFSVPVICTTMVCATVAHVADGLGDKFTESVKGVEKAVTGIENASENVSTAVIHASSTVADSVDQVTDLKLDPAVAGLVSRLAYDEVDSEVLGDLAKIFRGDGVEVSAPATKDSPVKKAPVIEGLDL